jgi:hypothetical protein
VSNSELVWIVREAGGSFGGEVGVMDTDSTDNQREGIDTDRMLVVVVECCNGDNAFATEAFRSLTKFVLLIPFPGTVVAWTIRRLSL